MWANIAEQDRESRRRHLEWVEKNPDRKERLKGQMRKSRLKLKYGLSPEAYDEMLLKQSGVCAICRSKCRRLLSVDHNHRTGKIRKLLCLRCNVGIGQFRDNPELVLACFDYLMEHQES